MKWNFVKVLKKVMEVIVDLLNGHPIHANYGGHLVILFILALLLARESSTLILSFSYIT
jgi:hypothetical protein